MGVAFVQGKGQDDKEIVYLHPLTLKAIKDHIQYNRIGSGALFRSIGNRGSERLSTRMLRYEIKSLLHHLEIEKTVHGFRHYFITRLLQNMDVRDVRKFSRHSNLEMLVVYDDEIDLKEKSGKVFECFNHIQFVGQN